MFSKLGPAILACGVSLLFAQLDQKAPSWDFHSRLDSHSFNLGTEALPAPEALLLSPRCRPHPPLSCARVQRRKKVKSPERKKFSGKSSPRLGEAWTSCGRPACTTPFPTPRRWQSLLERFPFPQLRFSPSEFFLHLSLIDAVTMSERML